MEKRFCHKCGKELPPDSLFCPACGQAVIPASIEQEANSSPKPETPETFSEEPIQENNPQERKPQESEPQEYTSSDEEACENPFVVVESCYQKGNVQSEAYLNAHNRVKRAYFWWKLRGFLQLTALYIAFECFFGFEHVIAKVFAVIIGFAAAFGAHKLCAVVIKSLTNIETFSNPFKNDEVEENKVEAGEAYLQGQFKAAHPVAFRINRIYGIVVWIFTLVLFAIYFFYYDAGIGQSIYEALRNLFLYGLIETGIWTFKLGAIIPFILLGMFWNASDKFSGSQSNFEPFFTEGSEINNSRTEITDGMILIDNSHCYGYITEYTDIPVFHLEYEFTNVTGKTSSAFNIFTAKASQNGVEAGTYFNLDLDDNSLKEVAPGATVRIAEEFQLNDTESELVVRFVETWDFSETDNVYLETRFDISSMFSDSEITAIPDKSDSESELLLTGKWYATNLDGSLPFVSGAYIDPMSSNSDAIYGLELDIQEINGAYFAYLYSNLHPFDYGFDYQTLDGDPFLPITQINTSTWEIRFDEIDPSSEYHRIMNTAVVTLSTNPLGEMFIEISNISTPVSRTRLYPSTEWLSGSLQYYDEDNSFSEYGEGDASPISALDCAKFLQDNLYGTWYCDTGVYADNLYLSADSIRIYTMRGSFYRDYAYYLDFSFVDDPTSTHTLQIPESPDGNYTELYLDSIHFYR